MRLGDYSSSMSHEMEPVYHGVEVGTHSVAFRVENDCICLQYCIILTGPVCNSYKWLSIRLELRVIPVPKCPVNLGPSRFAL